MFRRCKGCASVTVTPVCLRVRQGFFKDKTARCGSVRTVLRLGTFVPKKEKNRGLSPLFLTGHIFNNIGTNMKNNKTSNYKGFARNSYPSKTYSFGFRDETKGYGLEIRGGRVFEKIARTKIFYQKWI
jgi:hypothetical protein